MDPRIFKKNIFLYIILFYILLSGFFLYFHRFEIDPDGISYISLAKKYLQGDFQNAVNGLWSPLFPILLTPFIFLKVDPLLSAKLVLLLSGLGLLVIANKFLDLFKISANNKNIALFVLSIQLVFFALYTTTPDLLLTTILILHFTILYQPLYFKSIKWPALAGLTAALAYFSKEYAFIFCLVNFSVIHTIFYLQKRAALTKIIKHAVIFLFVFFILVSPWIYLLSNKYDYLTFGNSGRYNLAIFGPINTGQPFDTNRIIAPPNKTAISVWEDPSFENVTYFNPLTNPQDLKYQFFLFRKNLLTTFIHLETFSIFSLIIILRTIYSFWKKNLPLKKRSMLLYIIVSSAIYLFGYNLINVEIRYLWPIFILLLILAIYQLENINIKDSLLKISQVLFILSFIVYPLWYLTTHLYESKEYFDTANILKEMGINKENLATNKYGRKTLYISYHTNSRYFGQTGNYENTKELIKILSSHNIDYYILWKDEQFDQMNLSLSKYLPEVSNNKLPFKIYSLKGL